MSIHNACRTAYSIDNTVEWYTSQFELLSDYYEASILYHAYTKDGNLDKAEEYLSVMQSVEASLTDPDVLSTADALR